jgi:hypothetical protein
MDKLEAITEELQDVTGGSYWHRMAAARAAYYGYPPPHPAFYGPRGYGPYGPPPPYGPYGPSPRALYRAYRRGYW